MRFSCTVDCVSGTRAENERWTRRYVVQNACTQVLTYNMTHFSILTFTVVFYMRPSLFFPKRDTTNDMIDLVVYVMNCMLEKEHGCVHGLGLVANMTGWKMENFSVSYWHKFLMTLQGHRVPTRISAFLLVDPPRWFDSIWTIMKPMMSDDFAEKVAVVTSDDLGSYLMDGYCFHLPDDMDGGMLNTNALVQSFIAERKAIES